MENGGAAEHDSAREAVDLVPGTVIADYRLIKQIGEGARARVFLARSAVTEELVAIKFLRICSEKEQRRFKREARICARLSCNSIVKVKSFGANENSVYLIMEYVEGETLQSLLRRETTLKPADFVQIFTDTLNAIAYAHHERILHRDIKPANIIVYRDVDLDVLHAKVVDFGLAAIADSTLTISTAKNSSGSVQGSPAYMSPEQCRGDQIDQRSDIYSIGCTMFEALVGKPPFQGDSVYEVLTKQMEESASFPGGCLVEKRTRQMVLRCLAKEPASRFQSVEQLATELTAAVSGTNDDLADLATDERSSKRKVSSFAVITTTIIAAALLLCVSPAMRPVTSEGKDKIPAAMQKKDAKFSPKPLYLQTTPEQLISLSCGHPDTDPEKYNLRKKAYELALKNGDAISQLNCLAVLVEVVRDQGIKDKTYVKALENYLENPQVRKLDPIARIKANRQLCEYFQYNSRDDLVLKYAYDSIALSHQCDSEVSRQQLALALLTVAEVQARNKHFLEAVHYQKLGCATLEQLHSQGTRFNTSKIVSYIALADYAISAALKDEYERAKSRFEYLDDIDVAIAYNRLGADLFLKHDIADAKKYLLIAHQILGANDQGAMENGRCCYLLGMIALDQQDLKLARKYRNQAKECFEKTETTFLDEEWKEAYRNHMTDLDNFDLILKNAEKARSARATTK